LHGGRSAFEHRERGVDGGRSAPHLRSAAMVGGSSSAGIPETIGVVGVGTIGSAVVRGLCAPGGPVPAPRFILSPRGAAKATALAAEFPNLIRVASSNQEVVDAAECVIVAVLPKQAEEVLAELTFRKEQRVLSLISTLLPARLQELVVPAVDCAVAMPLPAVAKRQGATLLTPPKPYAEAMFRALGSCVAVDDIAQFRRMQCITTLMGDFYKRQLSAQEWLNSNGVGQVEAAAWVGAALATMAADSCAPGPETFHHLVAEQTPGGLNEMVWKEQEADGSYASLKHSLDSVHHRLTAGQIDPELAPASKRRRGSAL